MAETNDSDSVLEAFRRKVTARRNLRSLEAQDENARDAKKPFEENEKDKPPFKPSSF